MSLHSALLFPGEGDRALKSSRSHVPRVRASRTTWLAISTVTMASFLPVFFLFVITLGAMFAAWFMTPKGPQQTYV